MLAVFELPRQHYSVLPSVVQWPESAHFLPLISTGPLHPPKKKIFVEVYATDAQMWCQPNASSEKRNLDPHPFLYDIQSSSWACITHWSARIVSISVARYPSFTRELRYDSWESLPQYSLRAVMDSLLSSWPLIVSPCLSSRVDEDVQDKNFSCGWRPLHDRKSWFVLETSLYRLQLLEPVSRGREM